MEPSAKEFRRLLFVLGEVEQLFRSAGRGVPAESMAKLLRQPLMLPQNEFIEECRLILEGVLLGERDLTVVLIGALLDALESVDELLRIE